MCNLKIFLVTFFTLLIIVFTNAQDVEVQTQHGIIRGQVTETPFSTQLEQFLGIPYALPPIGSRRFANPEPYGDFPGGLWVAYDYPNWCIQTEPFINYTYTESEDCLYLNVWRPSPAESNKAVMVWIHGGGFSQGSGDDPFFQEQILAAYGDIILVSINYRLSALGFFYTGDDRMENGNFGLLDQQMALRWVQENIEAFGGDPNLVTIFGESAGAASVTHHMTLEGAEGLFSRVVAQSGSSNAYWGTFTPEVAAASTEQLALNTGCPNDPTLLDCLRGISALDLWEVSWFLGMSPVIDGATLLDHPNNLIASGEVQRTDLLIGFNKNEATLFIYDVVVNLTEEAVQADPYGAFLYSAAYLGQTLGNLTEDQVDELVILYEPNNIEDVNETKLAISDLVADIMFACPSEEFALAVNGQGVKVYEYYLTYRASTSPFEPWEGVVHGSDLQWIWGTPFADTDWPYTDLEEYFSTQMMDIWINFSKYGSTNSEWLPYTNDGASYAEFFGPGDFRYFSGEAVREEKCRAWQFSYP